MKVRIAAFALASLVVLAGFRYGPEPVTEAIGDQQAPFIVRINVNPNTGALTVTPVTATVNRGQTIRWVGNLRGFLVQVPSTDDPLGPAARTQGLRGTNNRPVDATMRADATVGASYKYNVAVYDDSLGLRFLDPLIIVGPG